jgi:hypothetical protein
VNTVQHATIDEAVYSMSSARKQRWNNGVMQPVSKQRLGKHTSAKVVTSSTIETVFSVRSVQSAYKRNECSDRVNLESVMSQL